MLSLEYIRKTVSGIGRALAMLLAVFSVLTYLASLALGPVLFFFTAGGLSIASRKIQEIPIDFFIAFTVPIPLEVSIGILFLASWVIFLACIVIGWRSNGGFPGSIKSAMSKSVSLARTNFLFIMPLVATALLYATVAIQQFQETQGVQTGSLSFPPETSPYLIFLNLAFAPLREEFAFRITSVGVPLGIFLILVGRYDSRLFGFGNRLKLILLAMASPEQAKIKTGYRNVTERGLIRGISLLEWVLILFTSLIFGVVHYLLGGGWQIGKISTAFLAGFVLGIVYVAYGAYAAILLHWFFNYYFTAFDLASSAFGGAFQLSSDLVESLNLAAGAIILVVFLLFSAVKLANYLVAQATQTGRAQLPAV